ncbi:MAG: 4-hydroxy-3-methylbut-2-enyl diphosphate reductase [Candidatus Aerophobetes bacterium]|nr:4-hydroxy-3-methylbut-2-enyl diphosphate reductase [Candidatus Aerophobetes bacterium]
MQIILPSRMGFCFGVERALKLVKDEAKKGGKIYTLGDLIHNPQVVEELKEEGIESVADLSQVKKGTIVIRAHGVGPSLKENAVKKGLKVLDATCPYVLKVQKIAKLISQQSYQVIVIGAASHPEVIGVTAGINKGKVYVIRTPQEAKKLPFIKKMGVIAQTTENLDNFRNIVKDLVEKSEECRVFNTICEVIKQRQKDAKNLAEEVPVIIVVGGHNSSNTYQLVKLCQNVGVKTYFIEREDDLVEKEYKNLNKVGIIGGTSTSKEMIERVKKRLLSIN